MGFEYLTNVPLEKAREDYLKLLESHGFSPQTEVIPVSEARSEEHTSELQSRI